MLLIPYIVTSLFIRDNQNNKVPNKATDLKDMQISLYIHNDDKVINVGCYDYICAVVAGEMPANYEMEALKAQAVASFTYLARKIKLTDSNNNEHKGAVICDDYNHCKAYLPKDKAKEKWSDYWFNTYYPHIEQAVESVLGEMITYDDEPINAVFHSISNGKTESSEVVWGKKLKYLQSVSSSYDKKATDYKTTVSFSKKEYKKLIKEALSIDLNDDITTYISDIKKSDAKTVTSVKIASSTISGTALRSALSLRSASFDYKISNDKITFTVYGYGHGVGMSQFGANEMAKQNKTYKEILEHYYTGTKISNYEI